MQKLLHSSSGTNPECRESLCILAVKIVVQDFLDLDGRESGDLSVLWLWGIRNIREAMVRNPASRLLLILSWLFVGTMKKND